MKSIAKYFKDWTQPILSQNGTIGYDYFAVSGNDELWKAFDGNSSSSFSVDGNSINQFIIYSQAPLRVTHISNNFSVNPYTFSFYCSEDGSTWKQMPLLLTATREYDVLNSDVYQYYRIYIIFNRSSDVKIREISLTAYTQGNYEDFDNFVSSSIIQNGMTNTKTFYPSTKLQSWIVPDGITSIHVDCVGSKGRNGNAKGGNGGRLECDLKVTPGNILYFAVGKSPLYASVSSYNASDIRTVDGGFIGSRSLNSRILVAGGGGSGGEANRDYFYNGGAGGGSTGGNGVGGRNATGGKGGTQTAGGAGSYGGSTAGGSAGTLGLGGDGGKGGGAGGSGYYGGGGGGCDGHNSYYWRTGGGGGSSYPTQDTELCTNVVNTQGYNPGCGYITITTPTAIFPVKGYKLLKE